MTAARLESIVLLAVLSGIVALFITAAPASACCTTPACGYCVSSSDECVCNSKQPVCNIGGCDCNIPCGSYHLDSSLSCVFDPLCGEDGAEIARKRFEDIDSDGDQRIDFDEAYHWTVANPPSNLDPDAEDFRSLLLEQFNTSDLNRDGHLAPEELDPSLARPVAASPK